MFSKFTLHPWHGVDPHVLTPEVVTCYIEITPTDSVKFEVDKLSGLLKVDRPQLFSNKVPALYGFIPQTYCGNKVADRCMASTGKSGIKGDGDPLDILVLTERNITQGNILLSARPIGGLRMIDKNEADDKILAVMEGDQAYSQWNTLEDLPKPFLDRLLHYFLTYKNIPGRDEKPTVEIAEIYSIDEARKVIIDSIVDYKVLVGDQS